MPNWYWECCTDTQPGTVGNVQCRDFLRYNGGEQLDEALNWIRVTHMVARSVIKNISGTSSETD